MMYITNVCQLLERSAERFPQKAAFGDPQQDIAFYDLMILAKAAGSRLAHMAGIGDAVAFYMEKSVPGVIGMFGAVYAGAFYSYIDTRQPAARAQKVLEVLSPKVIFTDRAMEEKAHELHTDMQPIVIEDFVEELRDDIREQGSDAVIDEKTLQAVRSRFIDTDPLYVNFTSGSTGTPKGVAVSHRSVIEFISYFTRIFGINETDILGNQAPFDFDVSVKDIYSGLTTGAKVQLIPREYFSRPTILMDYLCDHRVTSLTWAVSAMCFVSIMNGFDYRVPSDVRRVMFSGEVMPVRQLNIWQKFLPDAMYVNLYGPTEITCNCTYYILNHRFDKKEVIPAGIPFPNERVFLLDENDREVTEPGAEGEICVCGTCLALGYYKDPVRTAQAFMNNPLNSAYEERMYRTGDIGRYDSDGNLVYVSRKDFQIKHMGQRIELGEIEADAMAIDGIDRACCLYDSDKKKLILFYTGSMERQQVAKTLAEQLPLYMVPGRTIQIDEMPLNKNGKIDRNALKDMLQR